MLLSFFALSQSIFIFLVRGFFEKIIVSYIKHRFWNFYWRRGEGIEVKKHVGLKRILTNSLIKEYEIFRALEKIHESLNWPRIFGTSFSNWGFPVNWFMIEWWLWIYDIVLRSFQFFSVLLLDTIKWKVQQKNSCRNKEIKGVKLRLFYTEYDKLIAFEKWQ